MIRLITTTSEAFAWPNLVARRQGRPQSWAGDNRDWEIILDQRYWDIGRLGPHICYDVPTSPPGSEILDLEKRFL